MGLFKTLRMRFALWTAGMFLLILTGFSAYLYFSMQRALSVAMDDSLVLTASQVMATLDFDSDHLPVGDSVIQNPDNNNLNRNGFMLRVLNPQGLLLQESGIYTDIPVKLERSFITYIDPVSNLSLRIYTQPIIQNDRTVAIVQVAQSMHDIKETLEHLLVALLVSVPILVVVAGLSGYFLAARALAPIDQITSTTRRISAEDLSARLDLPTSDDEVGRLTQTLDDMLARLDDSFQRERQFTSDASHELRTPLTAMQAILGMMREKKRSPAEYQEALADLSEETDRLHTLVENLLQLARGTDRADSGLPAQINLASLVADVTDSLRPLAEAKQLTLTCDLPDPLNILGDSDALIRLFVNLLDNAIKYTEHGSITVSAAQTDTEITVRITDMGIGIPAKHLPHIFDRFYRVDESRTVRGAGLGLAIAQDIARAHGGRIEAESEAGQGAVFTVHLPLSS